MKVVKIVLRMSAPVAVTETLHLDALLTAVSPAMHWTKSKVYSSSTDTSKIERAKIDLCRIEYGQEWIYCCSAMLFPEESVIANSTFTRRKTHEDALWFYRQYMPGSGRDKERMKKINVVLTPFVYFYAATDNIDKLRSSLEDVYAVGGLRKQGYGTVKNIEVWECPRLDWQRCIVDDNHCATRRIPQEMCDSDDRPRRLTVKAPYWMHAADILAYDVGAKVYSLKGRVIV